MNRRLLLCSSLILPFTFFGLTGCKGLKTIEVGIHPWPGYEPLFLAQHFGWFDKVVRLNEGYNANDTIKKLKAGSISAACLTLDEILSVRASGLQLTIILVMNESVGADVVLARPSITTLDELKGKRIAVGHGTVGDLILQKILINSQFNLSEIELINASPSEQLSLWRLNKIDAAISYPPFAKQLEREGATRIFDSREFPKTIFDVLAVRTDHIRFNEGSLRSLVAGHLRALNHLRFSREDAMHRIATWRHLTLEEVEDSFRGLDLPNQEENRRLLSPSGELMLAGQMLNELMISKGLLQYPDTLADFVSSQFLISSQ